MVCLPLRRQHVVQGIQAIVRAFKPVPVVVYRWARGFNTSGMQTIWGGTETTIYAGEALFIPPGGQVQQLPLGLVSIDDPVLLITGTWPIQQADRVRLEGRVFQVSEQPNTWMAYLILRLKQVEQIAV